ncbi:MAG: SpoIIE family protein phosphatase [Anaerolineaceae bacterium]
MEIHVAIAKVDRYSSPEQGDQVEMIERPNGGVSIILAEGKLGGHRSKVITRKAVYHLLSLIFDGIHDGAASRAVLTALKNEYRGEAQFSLSLLSCDLETGTIILTKNNSIPVILVRSDQSNYLSCEGDQNEIDLLKPSVYQFQIENDFIVIMFSDGIASAGEQYDQLVEWCTFVEALMEEQQPTVQDLADFLLNQAIGRDLGQPHDDMTVVVVQVNPTVSKGVRRISVVLPL